MSKKLIITLLILVSIAFAGCHEQAGETGDDNMGGDGSTDGDGMDHTMPTVTFANVQFPATVMANQSFNVTYDVQVDEGTHTTNHIGAHWSLNSTAGDNDLTPDDFDGASPHVSSGVQLPGNHTIQGWSFPTAGTYYFRPHLQIVMDDMTHNFWGDEQTIIVS